MKKITEKETLVIQDKRKSTLKSLEQVKKSFKEINKILKIEKEEMKEEEYYISKLSTSGLLIDLLKARQINLEFDLDRYDTCLRTGLSIGDITKLLRNHIHSEIREGKWEGDNFIPLGFLETMYRKKEKNTKELL